MKPDWNGDGKHDEQDDAFLYAASSDDPDDPHNQRESSDSGKGDWLLMYILAMAVITIFNDRWVGWIGLSLLFWPWFLKN